MQSLIHSCEYVFVIVLIDFVSTSIDLDRACYLDHYDFLEPPHTLSLAQLQNWWADDENFDKVTRVEYGNIMPFPLNYTMPHRMRKSVLDKLEAAKLLKRKQVPDACEQVGSLAFELHPSHLTRPDAMQCDAMRCHDRFQAVNTARKCYQVLAARLGENQYFFNDKPSALDAIVFAHLALQLYAPMPHAYLSEELQKFGSLVRYCESILQSAFGIVPPILKPTETTAVRVHSSCVRSLALARLSPVHRGSPNASATGV